MLNNTQIAVATESSAADVIRCAPLILAELAKLRVTDPRAIAGALATIGVENHFQSIAEQGAPSYFDKYDNRPDLGNNQPGDGYKYRGRGLPQLTGKVNYKKYSFVSGVDLVANPDRLLDPAIGAKVFAAFFIDHGLDVWSIRANFRKVRVLYNGGNNGLQAFLDYVFNILDCSY